MRRTFFKEEEAPARLTPIPQGASESAVEPLPKQKAPESAAKAAPAHREKHASATKGKLLKAGIITFASLGAISALLPVLTGASVSDAAQNFNLKDAYSREHFRYLRGTTALKLGQHGAAVQALLSLLKNSPEALKLTEELFPRLLEAREYGHAAQALEHIQVIKPTRSYRFAESPSSATNQQLVLEFEKIGTHMGASLGLEKAMALVGRDQHLARYRAFLLRSLFFAVAPQELSALQKLVPTLAFAEQAMATEAILAACKQAGNWEAAWQWSASLPAPLRQNAQEFVLTELARANPGQATQRLATLRSTPEYLQYFTYVFKGLAGYHPQEAIALLGQLESPRLRENAIGMMLTRQMETTRLLSPLEMMALLDKQAEPLLKARTLIQLELVDKQALEPGGEEFTLKQILPRLAALGRQNPALAPLHDAYLIHKMNASYGVSKEQKALYLAQIQNPATRAAWTKYPEANLRSKGYADAGALLTKVRGNGFRLIDTNPK